MGHVRSDLTKLAQFFRRQNEILPLRDRLDALGQIIKTQTRLHAAGIPKLGSEGTLGSGVVAGFHHRRSNRRAVEIELRDQTPELAIESLRSFFADCLFPNLSLLVGCRLACIDRQYSATQRTPAMVDAQQKRAAHSFEKTPHDSFISLFTRVD